MATDNTETDECDHVLLRFYFESKQQFSSELHTTTHSAVTSWKHEVKKKFDSGARLYNLGFPKLYIIPFLYSQFCYFKWKLGSLNNLQ